MGKVTLIIESESKSTEEVREEVQGWIGSAYDLDVTEYNIHLVDDEPMPGGDPDSPEKTAKDLFIHHLTDIGVTPKESVPTIAEIFFTRDIEDLDWLKEVLGKHASGFVNPSQRRLFTCWWAHKYGLPYEEEVED